MELCKWTVDLGSLPSFQENSNMPHPNGFYTGEADPLLVSNVDGIVDNWIGHRV